MRLKPFQETGRDFLASRQCALLADEMRLGKTAQAVTACQKIDAKHVLVICPAIAVDHWRRDFSVWWVGAGPVLEVISYDRARIDKDKYGAKQWDVCILDESHFLKSPTTKRTRAILGKGGPARCSRHVWALSGTPAPNNASELWPLLAVFGATTRSFEGFTRHFCHVDPVTERVFGTKKARLPELRTTLGAVMLRRRKKEVAPELPACSLLDMPVEASEEYLDLAYPVAPLLDGKVAKARTMERDLKNALVGMSPDAVLTYVNQSVEHLATLRSITALLKAPALVNTILLETSLGIIDKCVVFFYHTAAAHVARDMLKSKGIKSALLYGGTPAHKRRHVIDSFQNNPKGLRVLFAQIKAAGTAIDLSAAHEGFLLEMDFVPGNNAQALERMGGYKQTLPVVIRRVTIPNSADDIISRVVSRKLADLADIYNEV